MNNFGRQNCHKQIFKYSNIREINHRIFEYSFVRVTVFRIYLNIRSDNFFNIRSSLQSADVFEQVKQSVICIKQVLLETWFQVDGSSWLFTYILKLTSKLFNLSKTGNRYIISLNRRYFFSFTALNPGGPFKLIICNLEETL